MVAQCQLDVRLLACVWIGYNRSFLPVPHARLVLGGRPTVGHMALDHGIGVRIPASQPISFRRQTTALAAVCECFEPCLWRSVKGKGVCPSTTPSPSRVRNLPALELAAAAATDSRHSETCACECPPFAAATAAWPESSRRTRGLSTRRTTGSRHVRTASLQRARRWVDHNRAMSASLANRANDECGVSADTVDHRRRN